MWKALRRAGEHVPRCRVQRWMRTHAIVGAKRRGRPWRTTRLDPHAHRRPDLVQRNFSVSGPDQLWIADVSYLGCREGLVFFGFVPNAYSRRVVGWQLASHMRTTLVLDALRMALGRRRPGADVALVHHSDRGSQYTSVDHTQTLADHGVLASVGSVGDAYDNALAESFVDSFKTELIADRVWKTRSQLELAVVRVHRLVQPRPPPPSPRRHPRDGGPLRSPERDQSLSQSREEANKPVSVKAGPAQIAGDATPRTRAQGRTLKKAPALADSQRRPGHDSAWPTDRLVHPTTPGVRQRLATPASPDASRCGIAAYARKLHRCSSDRRSFLVAGKRLHEIPVPVSNERDPQSGLGRVAGRPDRAAARLHRTQVGGVEVIDRPRCVGDAVAPRSGRPRQRVEHPLRAVRAARRSARP
jgi:transposase InsO family protein